MAGDGLEGAVVHSHMHYLADCIEYCHSSVTAPNLFCTSGKLEITEMKGKSCVDGSFTVQSLPPCEGTVEEELAVVSHPRESTL